MSMQLSLNEELDATVIYYGAVETDSDKLKDIGWPVLGVFGEEDAVIPLDSVNDFDSALDELEIENEIIREKEQIRQELHDTVLNDFACISVFSESALGIESDNINLIREKLKLIKSYQ